MNLLEGVLLGVIQGVTEWLPISSSGQSMIFLINLLNVPPEEAFSISALLHVGSLFAVLFYFRRHLRGILSEDRKLLGFLVQASLVSGVVGIVAYKGLRSLFSSASGEGVTMFIGVMLIITGIILRNTGSKVRTDFNRADAIFSGGAQGIAVLPGISRSGTTIAALLLRGIEQELALKLSFIMAIPAIFGLVLIEWGQIGFQKLITPPIVAGVGTAFIVSMVTMHYIMNFSRRIDFSSFTIFIGSIAFFLPLLLLAADKLTLL